MENQHQAYVLIYFLKMPYIVLIIIIKENINNIKKKQKIIMKSMNN